MLTSFFEKSKPIHFVLVSIFMVMGSFFWKEFFTFLEINTQNLWQLLLINTLLLFTIFLLDFIINKNFLTQKNSYSILFYVGFILMFPAVFFNLDVVITHLLLLLSFRRIISLSSEKNTKKKILDASLFITLASLFYFWSILFFLVLFFAIFQKTTKSYKFFFIPLVGFFTIIILATVYSLITRDYFSWVFFLPKDTSLNFLTYNHFYLLLPVSLMLALIIWSLFHFKKLFIAIKSNKKPTQRIVLLALIVLLFIVFLFPKKTGAEFIFIMAPTSILVTNLIESIQEKWFKETLLWLIVLMPLIIIFL